MHRPEKTLSPIPDFLRRPNMIPATALTGTVESSSRQTSWFHLFTYKRFHVLLNSLFKVLCNFPSRYLFAIGLAVIFSLRWSLPPALGCTLKQPDSSIQQFAHISLVKLWAQHPLWEKSLSEELALRRQSAMHCCIHAASPVRLKTTGLGAELFPFRSPLLRESLLVSFPPLIYMLKLSG